MNDGVDHLARLAGIDLDPAERERLARHLAELERLIDALPAVADDTDSPQAVDLDLRDDEAGAALAPDTVASLMVRRVGPWLDLPPVREDEA